MEDFTITFSSAELQYYLAFLMISLLLLFFIIILVCHIYDKVKKKREEATAKQKVSSEVLLRLRANTNMGIKDLHAYVHGKYGKWFDDAFVNAVDEEMKRRGIK